VKALQVPLEIVAQIVSMLHEEQERLISTVSTTAAVQQSDPRS
jgi:hypothetical protein